MLDQVIRRTALGALVKGVREHDLELIRSYWDLVYLYKFGIPKGDLTVPLPYEEPTPTIEWLRETDALLFELVNSIAVDPTPTPVLQGILQNRGPRLDAAKRAYQHHEEALGALAQEISALEA